MPKNPYQYLYGHWSCIQRQQVRLIWNNISIDTMIHSISLTSIWQDIAGNVRSQNHQCPYWTWKKTMPKNPYQYLYGHWLCIQQQQVRLIWNNISIDTVIHSISLTSIWQDSRHSMQAKLCTIFVWSLVVISKGCGRQFSPLIFAMSSIQQNCQRLWILKKDLWGMNLIVEEVLNPNDCENCIWQ